jgi:hypothetical protein
VTAARGRAVLAIPDGVRVHIRVRHAGRFAGRPITVTAPPGRPAIYVAATLPWGQSVLVADGGGRRASLSVRRVPGSVPGFTSLLQRVQDAATLPGADGRPALDPDAYRRGIDGLVALNGLVRAMAPGSRARIEASYPMRISAEQAVHGTLDDGRLAVALMTFERNADFWANPPADLTTQQTRLSTPTGPLALYDWRYLPGRGVGVHPLGTAQRLATIPAGTPEFFDRLAALLTLGVERRNGEVSWLVAEYPWYAVPAPESGPYWPSAMANTAVAFQLARAFAASGDVRYRDLMHRYLTALDVPFLAGGVSVSSDRGTWYLEYGGTSRLRVLNGFLQSVLDLGKIDAALGGGDEQAHRLFAAGVSEAAARLENFDLPDGWSAYSLARRRAPVTYHEYHVHLLRDLYERTGETAFARYADRWDAALAAYRRGEHPGPAGG